ncbi:MAG: sigma-54 dependent transcriptional regulator [Desulfobacterales bacterium]|nr:sigma-54 dependent transcriptional regulator [Desulfobacterales bacterium]
MNTILIVDDEPNYLIVLSELLREEGFEVFTAKSGIEGLRVVKENDIDLVLTDMRMPGMDGLELLAEVKEYNRDLPVIMITAFGEVEKAVVAMRAGAFNYLTKPFNNDDLVMNIRKAVEHYSLLKENRRLRDEVRDRYGFASIIGKNKRMRQIYQLIEKVAPTPASVLITGESGTGKELVARAIHFNSTREKAPFISVNCAALPETLLESELFGHEKGAFTGAASLRKGRFELADTGTLFLDEIGDIPLTLQATLLRVLQERTFERVGGTRPIKVDVRVVTATNKDIKDEVDKGRFRDDLYYRLNVVQIHLPPLRERRDDIPLLAGHFVGKFAKSLGRPSLEISTEALRLLTTLPWEGNVRELENTIERAAILCSGDRIEPEDVQPDIDGSGRGKKGGVWASEVDFEQLVPADVTLPEALSSIEEKMLRRALTDADSVQARAAERLGITKSLLQYKMKKYGLSGRQKPEAGSQKTEDRRQ